MEDKIGGRWRKASYSGNGGGNCVEVGQVRRVVFVRDTKASGSGPALRFSPQAWQRFTGAIKGS